MELASFSYLAKTVLIHEGTITLRAVVLVVSLDRHMLIGSFLSIEHLRARLAGDRRLPMIFHIHMLIGGVLRGEGASASLTFKDGCPVVESIHMLLATTLIAKLTSARVTFDPMVVVVHVSIAVLSVAEPKVTGATFIHLD